jgi:hypothetical protein
MLRVKFLPWEPVPSRGAEVKAPIGPAHAPVPLRSSIDFSPPSGCAGWYEKFFRKNFPSGTFFHYFGRVFRGELDMHRATVVALFFFLRCKRLSADRSFTRLALWCVFLHRRILTFGVACSAPAFHRNGVYCRRDRGGREHRMTRFRARK